MSTPLQALLEDLERELRRDPKGPHLVDRLGRYAREQSDWRGYALFDEGTYARNLVETNELFELLVLCWAKGQRSPIHNHQGSRCWMAVLDGTIEETLFRQPREAGPLVTGPQKSFERGQVAFITDDIGLHEIRSAQGRPAVSLHLYSRPIRRCQIYDRDTGRVTLRELAYHSIGGKPVAAGAR